MKKETRFSRVFLFLNHYLVFFLLVAFVITCCMMLFVSALSWTLDITFAGEHLTTAAKLTFGNVILLSLLFTVIDVVRRKFTIGRPIKKITEAANRIMQGDFSVQINPVRGYFGEDNFNPIIECFNKMAKELSSTETLRTDFVANVSHELKTPLAVMHNYASMLQTPGLSEKKRVEYTKTVIDTSRKLANLITNILKLNKLENQQIFPSVGKYDLSEQLCECLLQFENEWERKNIDITVDIPDGVYIYADGELMSLVWNNLFSNAFKFTDIGGKVSVELVDEDRYVTVKIIDTGCGMTPQVGSHIFEKFYQGDVSHSSEGNGLGLALVKRVVDIVRGELGVQSVKGKGSTFTVKLEKNANEKSIVSNL